jgi:hypothetical protein
MFGRDGKGDSNAAQTGPTPSDRNRHGGTACECCGNEYDKPLEIVQNGISHYFDSFECAINKLAPSVDIADAASLATALRRAGTFSVARIALTSRA